MKHLRRKGVKTLKRDNEGNSIIHHLSVIVDVNVMNLIMSYHYSEICNDYDLVSKMRIEIIQNLIGLPNSIPLIFIDQVNPKNGKNLLMECVRARDLPLFQFLFAHFEDSFDRVDFNNETVLHHCVRENWEDAVDWIIKNTKIDVSIKNKLGESVFDLAANHVYSDILKNLSKHFPKVFSSLSSSDNHSPNRRSARLSKKRILKNQTENPKKEKEKKKLKKKK